MAEDKAQAAEKQRRRYHADPEKYRSIKKVRKDKRVTEIREYLYNYLLERACLDCGVNGNPVILQFDHKCRLTKSFSVKNYGSTGHSLASVKAEVEKCEIRCANCHLTKSSWERGNGKASEGERLWLTCPEATGSKNIRCD